MAVMVLEFQSHESIPFSMFMIVCLSKIVPILFLAALETHCEQFFLASGISLP